MGGEKKRQGRQQEFDRRPAFAGPNTKNTSEHPFDLSVLRARMREEKKHP